MLNSIHLFHHKNHEIKSPTGIIMGPENHMWFTSLMSHQIGKINTTTNEIHLFTDPTNSMSMPANIYPDSKNFLWFTCVGSHHIGKIDPLSTDSSQSICLYLHPRIKNPVAIKRSKNGNMWFSARGSHQIGYFTPGSKQPEINFQLIEHREIRNPGAIYINQRDQLFFTNRLNDHASIGYLDCGAKAPEDTLAVHRFMNDDIQLRAWAEDTQNKIWLTTHAPDMLIFFDPTTFVKKPKFHFIKHPNIQKPDGIFLGADGYLYFVNSQSPMIGKINPLSQNPVSTLQFFSHDSIKGLCDIKPGPNHSMWFTDKAGDGIGQLCIPEAK